MQNERDFHRRRTAFVILSAGILVAFDGFEGSHADLLRQSGFDERQTEKLIALRPRGFALNGNVYAYQGDGFSELSVGNEEILKSFVPYFVRNGMLKPNGRLFSGMIPSEPGKIWRTVKEIQFS